MQGMAIAAYFINDTATHSAISPALIVSSFDCHFVLEYFSSK